MQVASPRQLVHENVEEYSNFCRHRLKPYASAEIRSTHAHAQNLGCLQNGNIHYQKLPRHKECVLLHGPAVHG